MNAEHTSKSRQPSLLGGSTVLEVNLVEMDFTESSVVLHQLTATCIRSLAVNSLVLR